MKEILCFIIRDTKLDNIEVVYKDDRSAEDVVRSMDAKTRAASAVGTSTVIKMLLEDSIPSSFHDATTEMLVSLSGKTSDELKKDLTSYARTVVTELVTDVSMKVVMTVQLALVAENILMRNVIENKDFSLSETTIEVRDLTKTSEDSVLNKILRALGVEGEVEFQPFVVDGVEIEIGGKLVEKPEENDENEPTEEGNDLPEGS